MHNAKRVPTVAKEKAEDDRRDAKRWIPGGDDGGTETSRRVGRRPVTEGPPYRATCHSSNGAPPKVNQEVTVRRKQTGPAVSRLRERGTPT